MKKYKKSEKKGRPRVFEISSVSEFVELSTWLYTNNYVVYRGQTKEKGWPLIPSVGRNLSRSQFALQEVTTLAEFKRESIPYLDIVPENEWQWLTLAQHNRLPTRLLDWSANPLVALWFAVKDLAIDDKPGIIWAFWPANKDVVSYTKDLGSPFSIKKTRLYIPEHVFPSVQAQSCVFTVHSKGMTNSSRFHSLEQIKDSDLLLTKIEVPSKLFPTFRYHLFKVGISPSSLFPGLSGIVDKIRYKNMLSIDEGKA